MTPTVYRTDPALDLTLERVVDVAPELVWRAWTTPAQLMRWFTPAPWTTVECEIDLRPGGLFRTVMRSPEGKLFPNVGCYLETVENRRLAWTNVLDAGFRPAAPPSAVSGEAFTFTAVVSMEAHGTGTKYTALVMHGNEAACRKHEAMGFRNGWGTALDQLVSLVRAG